MPDRVYRPEVFADEEAIETRRCWSTATPTSRPEVFADEEAIETFCRPDYAGNPHRGPEVFADEEAIETGVHGPDRRNASLNCPEVFADEEAIETSVDITCDQSRHKCVRKYSLTKKRLRQKQCRFILHVHVMSGSIR